jgi:predicted PhzF superfamily epimerase YddE/YHI9
MDRYIFYILDVFAEEKYAGNQLVVASQLQRPTANPDCNTVVD